MATNSADAVTVPDGYAQQVVIRWGNPVLAGAPRFDARKQSAKAQTGQFGYNANYMALLDIPHRPRHKLLVVNHEYTSEHIMFYGYDPVGPTREHAEITWAAHGLTVLVGDVLNRRITATTPFTLIGPAAGSNLLKTTAAPTRRVLGTLAKRTRPLSSFRGRPLTR
ncbi:PhoX family protein [Streptomyces sp. NPDC127123]|uniref:PhoX family protein n=1 Tax=Streptomyces sp. NPDC127123 TaxID=3345372 RepID=UPI003634DCD0